MGKNFRVEEGKNYTNGEVRMRIYDGDGKGLFKWVFAGNTHEIFQEGILRDMASMRLGNFDSIIQATRRNKYERFKRERNALIGERKMVSKIDIIVKKIKVIVNWYNENTESRYTIGIEKAEELLAELEEIK